jgi:hypothetical protein
MMCACACAGATANAKLTDRFTRLDGNFQPSVHKVAPTLLVDAHELDAAPPFKSVGILEVQGREKETINAFLARVEQAGAELGCDVLLQRDAYRLGLWVRRPPVRGLNGVGHEWIANDQAVWQFVCGVNGSTPEQAILSLESAFKAAARLRENEFGTQVCEPYVPLGSHILKTRVCVDDSQRQAYH